MASSLGVLVAVQEQELLLRQAEARDRIADTEVKASHAACLASAVATCCAVRSLRRFQGVVRGMAGRRGLHCAVS